MVGFSSAARAHGPTLKVSDSLCHDFTDYLVSLRYCIVALADFRSLPAKLLKLRTSIFYCHDVLFSGIV